MSAIENALNEVVIFVKKFFKTYYSLVIHPKKVLQSILPKENTLVQEKNEFFEPFLFYVISTLPAIFVYRYTNVDFYSISRDLPVFFNNLTIQKIFIMTLPNMIAGSVIAYLGGFLFNDRSWRVAFRKFIYYSLAAPLLSLTFCGVGIIIINHVFLHDFSYGYAEPIIALLLLLIVIVRPAVIVFREKFQSTLRHIIFFVTPILSIVLLLFVMKLERDGVGYTRSNNMLPDDLICEETDIHNFTPEIKMTISPQKVFFTYSLWFFNPTNRIFWVPNEFDVDILNPVYYDDKEMRSKYPFFVFKSKIQKKYQVDSLMIKPNQTKKFEYTCLINKSIIDPAFLKTLIENKGGAYSPQVKMDYMDILQNSYEKRNSNNIKLVFDSTIIGQCPTDSL